RSRPREGVAERAQPSSVRQVEQEGEKRLRVAAQIGSGPGVRSQKGFFEDAASQQLAMIPEDEFDAACVVYTKEQRSGVALLKLTHCLLAKVFMFRWKPQVRQDSAPFFRWFSSVSASRFSRTR